MHICMRFQVVKLNLKSSLKKCTDIIWIWQTVKEYLCHKKNRNRYAPIVVTTIFPDRAFTEREFIIRSVLAWSINTTSATCEAWTANSAATEFTNGLSDVWFAYLRCLCNVLKTCSSFSSFFFSHGVVSLFSAFECIFHLVFLL